MIGGLGIGGITTGCVGGMTGLMGGFPTGGGGTTIGCDAGVLKNSVPPHPLTENLDCGVGYGVKYPCEKLLGGAANTGVANAVDAVSVMAINVLFIGLLSVGIRRRRLIRILSWLL